MNNTDKQYLDIMSEILENGTLKHTRAGDTLSVFGKTMEFNLQEGLPLLTTKKVYYKGIIHELIWFLHGDTNIKYLVDNKVNIWTDDAYRWFKSLTFEVLKPISQTTINGTYQEENRTFDITTLTITYTLVWGDMAIPFSQEDFKTVSKDQFVEFVKTNAVIKRFYKFNDTVIANEEIYKFGDLGDVYGKQWRRFGISNTDQITNIIKALQTNPDDRRMLCIAYNPDVLGKVALPPCHMMFQFYTRELTYQERFTWLQEHGDNKYDEWKSTTMEKLDELGVPTRELSLSYTMRSNDWCAGQPYNTPEYAMLVYILCNICNMVPGKVIYFGGDVHIYCNHIEQAKEQLQRQGYDKLPQFVIKRHLTDINDITFDDFEVVNYQADAPIHYKLNVG